MAGRAVFRKYAAKFGEHAARQYLYGNASGDKANSTSVKYARELGVMNAHLRKQGWTSDAVMLNNMTAHAESGKDATFTRDFNAWLSGKGSTMEIRSLVRRMPGKPKGYDPYADALDSAQSKI